MPPLTSPLELATRLRAALLAHATALGTAWQQAVQNGEVVWVAAPQGYGHHLAALAPHARLSADIPCTQLDESTSSEPTSQAWCRALDGAPRLVLARPSSRGEGELRLQGVKVVRLSARELGWPAEGAGADPDPELHPLICRWQPKLGSWPLAWQLLAQALEVSGRQGEDPQQLLTLWGADLLARTGLPPQLYQALILMAPDPVPETPLDLPTLSQLCGCGAGELTPWLHTLQDAGWLLPQAEGWQWQPLIAWLLARVRLQPGTDWQALLPNLTTLPLNRLLMLLPYQEPQAPALLLRLLPAIGWHCIELAQGEWLNHTLFTLPLATRRAHPPLTLLEAWVELEITKHSERARAALEQLDLCSLDTQGQQVAQLLFAITDFHFDDAASALQKLKSITPLPAPWHTAQRLTYAMACLITGELTTAQPILDAQFACAESSGQYHLKLVAANRLAQLHFYRGDWYATERVLQQAREFAHSQGLASDPALDSNYRMLADLALLRGEPERAEQWMSRGQPLAAAWGAYWELPYRTQQLLALLWRNERHGLRQQVAALDERRFSQHYCRQWQFRTGQALAWGYIRLEERNGLLRLLERTPWHQSCGDLYDLQDNLLHGWLSLLCEQPLQQEAQLQPLTQLASHWQCAWLEWQARLLLLCLQAEQDEIACDAWHELLTEMLDKQAKPKLPFLLAGARVVTPLQSLCRWSQCREPVLDFARQLLAQLTAPLPEATPLPEQDDLSPRQRQILRLIAQGLSNEQIAERLFVAPSTIKTHINHLYAKLGVNNRAEAQALARQRLG